MQQTLLHSVWHEWGCTVWVSVFRFSLLCFAKFNFKSICSVLSSLSLSFFLFSSPSLTLSQMCSLVPRQYFVWVFPQALTDPCGALCSENERLWIQHQPFLSFSHSLALSLLLLWVLLSLRYFWRWMEQVLIQLSAPGSKFSSWGTTVWTHHWNLLVVPNMVVHENGQWLLIQASEDFILMFKDILVYWHSSWLQFCVGTWDFGLSGKGMSARVECVYVRWHFECMYAVSFTGYSDHVLNICIFFWSWLVLI